MNNWAADLLANTDALRGEAKTHLQAQRWADAAECLQMLAAIDPLDAWVRQWQVIVAIAQDQPETAVQAAQAALHALPPGEHTARADVLFNLGQALTLLGRRAEALVALDQALVLNPALACAQQARSRLLAAGPPGQH